MEEAERKQREEAERKQREEAERQHLPRLKEHKDNRLSRKRFRPLPKPQGMLLY